MYFKIKKYVVWIFIFMFWGTFTHLSIMTHYSWVEYGFNRILLISIFTAIGTATFFYWWEATREPEEDDVPPKEMPEP